MCCTNLHPAPVTSLSEGVDLTNRAHSVYLSLMKIEKNVPMPTSDIYSEKPQAGLSRLLRQMEIGDSIIIPAKLRSGLFTNARWCGVRLTSRKDGDSYRVWRKE